MAVAELQYRLVGAAGGLLPGAHKSRSSGAGFEFRNLVPLADGPDARRIDLHASLRDPFGRWFVRRFDERRAITVCALADLSASMGFDAGEAGERRMRVLGDFVESLGMSAWRVGDRFGFVAADERVREDWLLAPTRQRGVAEALGERLRAFEPRGRSAAGLRDAHGLLPARRGLIFLLSDFHWPLEQVEAVLDSLALHEVVPVVLWSRHEFELAAAHGVAHVAEPESGRRQWLWWRSALRERWAQAAAERRAALGETFRRHRVRPLYLQGAFDADAATRHFLA